MLGVVTDQSATAQQLIAIHLGVELPLAGGGQPFGRQAQGVSSGGAKQTSFDPLLMFHAVVQSFPLHLRVQANPLAGLQGVARQRKKGEL